jgi:ubiquitin carboxyl-terminal hydrolase 25/28
LVNVSDDGLDIYDGLSHFLDDTVEFEGRQAEMEIDILELPPILQIQLQVRCPVVSSFHGLLSPNSLQRVQFDRETLQARKNNSYVKFDETLRMDRFLDAINAPKKAQSRIIRNNLRRCRARIAALSQSPVSGCHVSLVRAVADFRPAGRNGQRHALLNQGPPERQPRRTYWGS